LKKEVYYRGWFKDYEETLRETRSTISSISCKLERNVKFEWEARVPKCKEICGGFIVNINTFIEDAIKKYISKSTLSEEMIKSKQHLMNSR
jgi:hypothetical protein